MAFRLPSQKAFKPNRPRPRAPAAGTPKQPGGWVGPSMSRAALAAANLSPENAEAAATEREGSAAGPSGTQTQGGDDGRDGGSQLLSGSQVYPSLTQALTQSTQDTVLATPLERKGGQRPEVIVRGDMDEDNMDTPSRPKPPVFTVPPRKPVVATSSSTAQPTIDRDAVQNPSGLAASNSRTPVPTGLQHQAEKVDDASRSPALSASRPVPAKATSNTDQLPMSASETETEHTSSNANPIGPSTKLPSTGKSPAQPIVSPPSKPVTQKPSGESPARTVVEPSAYTPAQTPTSISPTVEPAAPVSTVPTNPPPRASAPPPNRFSVPPPPRPRQPSLALSTSSTASKSGNRMNLLNAAREAAANGTSGPSPGRLPSRSRSASVQPPAVPIVSNLGGPPTLATDNAASSPSLPPAVASSASEAPSTLATASMIPPTIAAEHPVSPAASSRPSAAAQTVAGPSRPIASRSSASQASARSVTPVESPAQAATPLFLEADSDNETAPTDAGTPAPVNRPMTTAEAAQAILDGMTRQRGTSLPAARRIGKRDKKNPGIKISKRVYKDKTAKKTSRKQKSAEAEATPSTSVEPENAEPPPPKPKRKMPQRGTIVKQLRKRPRRTTGEGDEGAGGDSDGDMYITKIVDKPRGQYQSAGLAGTDQDKRLSQNRDKRKTKEKKPTFVQADISAFEPGEMVGGEVDINTLTMADIATNITHGQVSARGVTLSSYALEDKAEKRRQKMQNAWDHWVNGQPARRKARRDQNLDRERRRNECREEGRDPDEEVSDDEPDSEEDYAVAPDRFTPPEDPERVARIQPRVFGQTVIHPTNGSGAMNRDGEDEDGAGWEGMEGLEGLGEGGEDDEIQLEVVENPEGMDEDGEEDELAAAGFAVAEGDDTEMANADDDDDDEEVNWEDIQQEQYGRHNYLEDREEQRRRDIEDRENRVVYEEDDTLKMVNSTTYGKAQPRGAPWSAADIDTLYSALSEVGINSDIIKGYFPTRTRNQVNRRMVKEQRENPEKFWAAVEAKKDIDIEHLKVAAAYDDNDDWSAEDRFLAQCKKDAEMCRKDYVDPPEGEEVEGMELETLEDADGGEKDDQEVDFDNLSTYDAGEEGETLVGLDDEDDEDRIKENDKDEDEDDD